MYNWVLDEIHLIGHDTGTPTYRLIPDNYGTANAMLTSETSVVMKRMTVEPNSGRIWAYVRSNGANDGLWRRNASVDTPSWTKVVGAAANNTQEIYVLTTGDVWYNNTTAGNWYQLQNGAAGNAQVNPPAGLLTTWNPDSAFWPSCPFRPQSTDLLANAAAFTFTNATAALASTAALYWQTILAVHDNTAAAAASTYKFSIPYEALLNSRMERVGRPSKVSKLYQLNATYYLAALHEYECPTFSYASASYGATHYGRDVTGEWARSRYALVLINATTNIAKYLGILQVPSLQEYAIDTQSIGAQYPLCLQSARLKNSVLDLFLAGNAGVNNNLGGAVTKYSDLWQASIPLIKLDF